uniref:Sorting nexin 12 n=1 Tax=Urocitellus parryii TaxID=9999 RepID=A0A8D2H5X8_UROPR
MSDTAVADTRRLNSKPQDLTDAYGPPSNFLEIDIFNPQTVGVGRARFTTYEVRMRTNLPIFKLKESCVRRRYSDFEWLKNELERDSKIVVPPLPGKALKRQLPFRGDEGIFEESFIEERRQGLEQFINKIAGHPLAQNERCLHMFLQEEAIDRNYVPGKGDSPLGCSSPFTMTPWSWPSDIIAEDVGVGPENRDQVNQQEEFTSIRVKFIFASITVGFGIQDSICGEARKAALYFATMKAFVILSPGKGAESV